MSTLDLFASKIRSTLYKYNNGISQLPLEQLLKECQNELDDLSKKKIDSKPNQDGKEKIRQIKKKVESKIDDLIRQSKRKKADIEDLNLRIDTLKQCVRELETLLMSDLKFKFVRDIKQPRFEYDGQNANVFFSSEANMLHELRHAFQFETGKIDFVCIDGESSPGLIYDYTDEEEAFKVEYAYKGVLKFRIKLSEAEFTQELQEKFKINRDLSKAKDEVGVREIKKMKDIEYNILVKISDGSLDKVGLYEKLSISSLDKNSLIKDIIYNNYTNRTQMVNKFNFNQENNEQTYIEYVKIYKKEESVIYIK